MRDVDLGVANNGKSTSSASVCLFSQFKEITGYILRLNKTLLNDHLLGPTSLDLKKLSESKFKNFENSENLKDCRLSELSNECFLSTTF